METRTEADNVRELAAEVRKLRMALVDDVLAQKIDETAWCLMRKWVGGHAGKNKKRMVGSCPHRGQGERGYPRDEDLHCDRLLVIVCGSVSVWIAENILSNTGFARCDSFELAKTQEIACFVIPDNSKRICLRWPADDLHRS